jgi:Transglutaminase-like superfamily
MNPRIWVLLLAGTLGAQAPVDPDSDGDGLSDFLEIHKHLTDPARKDTDGDGIPDGDWNERREYSYTVRSVIRVLRPAEIAAMNDDWQDARLVKDHGSWIEAEVVHYPFSTAGEAIPSNPRWAEDAAAMRSWLEPTATSGFDAKMRAALVKGIDDYASLDDKALVERTSRFALGHAKYHDGFTTFYTAFEGARPVVPPELRATVEAECRKSGRKIEEEWAHELFAQGMFENRAHGSCTSTAIYLAGCLRAVGIPARIVLCIPLVDANDPAELEMVRKNVKHHGVRKTILAAVEATKGWSSHTFNEVWVAGRWRRLNYTRLGQPILDASSLGLMTHVATLRDWADANAAATIGKRQAKGDWNDALGTVNPYSAVAVDDLFGARCKVPNPPVEDAPTASARAPVDPPPELTIDSVMWSDDASLGDLMKERDVTLLARVKGWTDWDPFKAFTQQADRRFFLEAAGHPTLGVESSTGGLRTADGALWVVLPLGPADRKALARGTAYELKPRNEKPSHRWLVADGLKVVRR